MPLPKMTFSLSKLAPFCFKSMYCQPCFVEIFPSWTMMQWDAFHCDKKVNVLVHKPASLPSWRFTIPLPRWRQHWQYWAYLRTSFRWAWIWSSTLIDVNLLALEPSCNVSSLRTGGRIILSHFQRWIKSVFTARNKEVITIEYFAKKKIIKSCL